MGYLYKDRIVEAYRLLNYPILENSEEVDRIELDRDQLVYTTEITPSIEKQARVLDKESKLMAGEMKEVTGAYVLPKEDGEVELVGALWTEWEAYEEWRDMSPEPEYMKGYDIFSSDIAVFKKYRKNGVGGDLVKQSHRQFIRQSSKYKNPKAIIEITSDTMRNAREKLGYTVIDQDDNSVKMTWESKKN